jgi:multiple sugar transport system substrate-binding protein
VVAEFQKTYPNMEVEPDFATYANLNEKISTSIAGGSSYDVITSGVGWIQPFAARGVYADLAQFGVTAETIEDELVPALVAPSMWEDAIYGYPVVIDPRAIAFRKSEFEAAGLDPDNPPATFDELKEAAETLTQRDGSGNITRPGFDFNTTPGNYRQAFIIFLNSLGTTLFTEDGEPNFNNEDGVEVLEWMASMINNVQPFGQQNATQDEMVLTGEAPMGFVKGSVDCTEIDFCDDLGFFLPDNGKAAQMVGGDIASVASGSQNPEAAWAFIEAMTTVEAMDAIGVIQGKIPARSDVPDDLPSLNNPLAQFQSDNLVNAIYEGGPANWLDIRSVFGPTIDEVILGDLPAEEGLARIEAATQ